MKVAILTDTPFLYEDTMYLSELEKRLLSKGIHSKIFLVHSSSLFKKIDAATGIGRIINASKLSKELSNFDVVDVQFTFPLGFSLAFLSSLRLLNRPIIIHTHGYDIFTVPSINYGIRRNSIGQFLTTYTWKRASRIITVCKKSKTELVNAGINEKKIDLIYNGIDESLFKRVRSELPTDISTLRNESDLIFLSIASIVPVKNHQRLVQAFERLVRLYNSKYKIKLLLIGNRPEYSTVNLGDHSNIIYAGKKAHHDLPGYFNMADAFILPSLSEAHPWSLLEAMSCELPSIASNVGGIPETLPARFLFDPYNAEDILNKLSMIVEMDKKEREAVGASNRETVLRSFTINEHANRLKKVFEDAIQY